MISRDYVSVYKDLRKEQKLYLTGNHKEENMCKMGLQESGPEYTVIRGEVKKLTNPGRQDSGKYYKKLNNTMNTETKDCSVQRIVTESACMGSLDEKGENPIQTAKMCSIMNGAAIENFTTDTDEEWNEDSNEAKSLSLHVHVSSELESRTHTREKKKMGHRLSVCDTRSKFHKVFDDHKEYKRATVDQASGIMTPADSDFRRIRQIFPWLVPIF